MLLFVKVLMYGLLGFVLAIGDIVVTEKPAAFFAVFGICFLIEGLATIRARNME